MMFSNSTFSGIDPSVQAQLDKAQKDKQSMVNAAKLQQLNTAKSISECLYNQIIQFQHNLLTNEDVVLMLVQFNQTTTIRVTNIGYIGTSLICFWGKDTKGNSIELIQHISQLNFLLSVELVPTNSEKPDTRRKIGFVGQVESCE